MSVVTLSFYYWLQFDSKKVKKWNSQNYLKRSENSHYKKKADFEEGFYEKKGNSLLTLLPLMSEITNNCCKKNQPCKDF